MNDLRQRVRFLLTNGSMSHDELTRCIFGCDHCGKVTNEEREKVSSVVIDMHRERVVRYTIDREVELR